MVYCLTVDHLTAVLLEFFTQAKHKYDSAQDTSHDILADKHYSLPSVLFSLSGTGEEQITNGRRLLHYELQ